MWCCVSVMLLQCNALPVKGSPTRSYAPKLSSRSCRSAGECLRSHKSLRRHHRWKDADSLINQFSYAQYLNRTTLLSTPFFGISSDFSSDSGFFSSFSKVQFLSSCFLKFALVFSSNSKPPLQASLWVLPLSSPFEFSLRVLLFSLSSSPLNSFEFSGYLSNCLTGSLRKRTA